MRQRYCARSIDSPVMRRIHTYVVLFWILTTGKIFKVLSFSQNSVSFGKSSGKSVLKAAFSPQSRVAFPKTEVLGKPPL
jgi:hypothetical protein